MTDPLPLAERIAAHPFMRGVPPQFMARLAENALGVRFAPGETIATTGDPANRFYLLESGQIQVESRNGGSPVVIQRIGAGEVLGFSWLFVPYEWQFDARAVAASEAIFLYGTRLREMCEDEPLFGFTLMKAAANVLLESLQSTRNELLRISAQPETPT